MVQLATGCGRSCVRSTCCRRNHDPCGVRRRRPHPVRGRRLPRAVGGRRGCRGNRAHGHHLRRGWMGGRAARRQHRGAAPVRPLRRPPGGPRTGQAQRHRHCMHAPWRRPGCSRAPLPLHLADRHGRHPRRIRTTRSTPHRRHLQPTSSHRRTRPTPPTASSGLGCRHLRPRRHHRPEHGRGALHVVIADRRRARPRRRHVHRGRVRSPPALAPAAGSRRRSRDRSTPSESCSPAARSVERSTSP